MGSQTNRLPDMRPAPQRRFIPVQDYPVRPPVLSRHFLHDGEGSVGRSVIRKDDFNRPFIILPEYAPDGIPDAMLLIMPGQDNADGRESRRIHEKKCRKGSEKNERNIALPRLHIRHHVHTGFQIRLGNSGFSMNGQRIVPRPHGTGGVWRYSGWVCF